MTAGRRIASAVDVAALIAEVPHPNASLVYALDPSVVALLLSSPRFLVAGIDKDIWKPFSEQRAQDRQAGGDDGQVGLEGSEARPPRFHETDLGGFEVFLGEHAEPHDPENGDPVRAGVSVSDCASRRIEGGAG